jgi:hypothetical protein
MVSWFRYAEPMHALIQNSCIAAALVLAVLAAGLQSNVLGLLAIASAVAAGLVATTS